MEMQTYLNYDDVIKPQQKGGILRFCSLLSKETPVSVEDRIDQDENFNVKRKGNLKKSRHSEKLMSLDSDSDSDRDLPKFNVGESETVKHKNDVNTTSKLQKAGNGECANTKESHQCVSREKVGSSHVENNSDMSMCNNKVGKIAGQKPNHQGEVRQKKKKSRSASGNTGIKLTLEDDDDFVAITKGTAANTSISCVQQVKTTITSNNRKIHDDLEVVHLKQKEICDNGIDFVSPNLVINKDSEMETLSQHSVSSGVSMSELFPNFSSPRYRSTSNHATRQKFSQPTDSSSVVPGNIKSRVRTPPSIEELSEILNNIGNRETLSPVDIVSLVDKWEKEENCLENETLSKVMACDKTDFSKCKSSVPISDIKVCTAAKNSSIISKVMSREMKNNIINSDSTFKLHSKIDDYRRNIIVTEEKLNSGAIDELFESSDSDVGLFDMTDPFGDDCDDGLLNCNIDMGAVGESKPLGEPETRSESSLLNRTAKRSLFKSSPNERNMDAEVSSEGIVELNCAEFSPIKVNKAAVVKPDDNTSVSSSKELDGKTIFDNKCFDSHSDKEINESICNVDLFESSILRAVKTPMSNVTPRHELPSQLTFTQALSRVQNLTCDTSVIDNTPAKTPGHKDTVHEQRNIENSLNSCEAPQIKIIVQETQEKSENEEFDDDMDLAQFDLGFIIDEADDVIPPSPEAYVSQMSMKLSQTLLRPRIQLSTQFKKSTFLSERNDVREETVTEKVLKISKLSRKSFSENEINYCSKRILNTNKCNDDMELNHIRSKEMRHYSPALSSCQKDSFSNNSNDNSILTTGVTLARINTSNKSPDETVWSNKITEDATGKDISVAKYGKSLHLIY